MQASTSDSALSTRDYIVDRDDLRIWDHDATYWGVEWSYDGRVDLRGVGWVAVVGDYTPDAKHKFSRQFLPRAGGPKLIRKSDRPIVIQFAKLYDGTSMYHYVKRGGAAGWLAIEGGKARHITPEIAVTILSGTDTPTPVAVPTLRITTATISDDDTVDYIPLPAAALVRLWWLVERATDDEIVRYTLAESDANQAKYGTGDPDADFGYVPPPVSSVALSTRESARRMLADTRIEIA